MSDTLMCGVIMVFKLGHYDSLTRTVQAPRQTSNRGKQATSRNINGPSPGPVHRKGGRACACPRIPHGARTDHPSPPPCCCVHSLPERAPSCPGPPSFSSCSGSGVLAAASANPTTTHRQAKRPGSSGTTTQAASPPQKKPIHTEPRRKWDWGQDAGEPGGFRGCSLSCASSVSTRISGRGCQVKSCGASGALGSMVLYQVLGRGNCGHLQSMVLFPSSGGALAGEMRLRAVCPCWIGQGWQVGGARGCL